MANVIVEKSFSFAVEAVKLCSQIQKKHKHFIITNQLFRSATSIGAIIQESQNAETRKDFIHKLGIAQKECAETIYWLRLLHQSDFISDSEFQQLNEKAQEILRILRSIILTTKKNSENKKI